MAMDVSELRRQILRALDDARKDAAGRRVVVDAAAKAYETFLADLAVPLVRQAAQVLNATGQAFSVHTPAGSVRLVSDASPFTFVELELGATKTDVVGRVSVTRGRQGVVLEERPIAPGKTVAALTEQDVSEFLVTGIPKLVVRS